MDLLDSEVILNCRDVWLWHQQKLLEIIKDIGGLNEVLFWFPCVLGFGVTFPFDEVIHAFSDFLTSDNLFYFIDRDSFGIEFGWGSRGSLGWIGWLNVGGK
jgi:hypothetical protein